MTLRRALELAEDAVAYARRPRVGLLYCHVKTGVTAKSRELSSEAGQLRVTADDEGWMFSIGMLERTVRVVAIRLLEMYGRIDERL
jgi:hypothetical protein